VVIDTLQTSARAYPVNFISRLLVKNTRRPVNNIYILTHSISAGHVHLRKKKCCFAQGSRIGLSRARFDLGPAFEGGLQLGFGLRQPALRGRDGRRVFLVEGGITQCGM